MNANIFSHDLVYQAYRLLKQDAYYDKMDTFLRANVAAYEAGDSFQQRQDWPRSLTNCVREHQARSPSERSRCG